MPKRGAFALVLTTFALVLLLNFQDLPSRRLRRPRTAVARLAAPRARPAPSVARADGHGRGHGHGHGRRAGRARAAAGSGRHRVRGTGTSGTPATTGRRTVDGPVIGTRFGSVQVEITVDGTSIVDVAALQLPQGDRRTDQISSYVEPMLRTQALQAQGANIDGVSGATYTSNAYARSLQAALDSAGI